MDPMGRVVDCYQTVNEEVRSQSLNAILSDEGNRSVVQLWLSNHPVSSSSPMIADLRNRITAAPTQLQVTFDQGTVAVESKILTGKSSELVDEFTKSPDSLRKQIDLIKTHVELNTMSAKDVKKLLPLLLDHASTNDVAEILKAVKIETAPTNLTRSQLLRLSALLATRYLWDTPMKLPSVLTKPYMEIIQKRLNSEGLANDIRAIKNIVGLSQDEKDAAIAHYIDHFQVPLADVKKEIGMAELSRLAPHLRYVDLRGFEKLPIGFLKKCPNVNRLFTNNNKDLEGVQELSQCQEFYCRGGLNITALPALPVCQKLQCSETPLKSLPALPLCKEIECADCSSLTALPALPACQNLNCRGCSALHELPDLPLCKELYCSWCKSLTALPALPQCQKVGCSNCDALRAFSALPLCQELYCNECPGIRALTDLPLCKELFCQNCTGLRALPPLPSCQKLSCYGCPLTELPEMPWNAHVVTVGEGFEGLPLTILKIDIEKFATDPVSLLHQLGTHLLNNKPFPNIYYYENGELNKAIDVGGIRRDFTTKLCLNLFNEKGLKREDNFPIAVSDKDEKAYRALGSLLAQCYPASSDKKTGPLFAPEVYQCLLTPNPKSDEWYLTNYLTLINASQAAKDLLDLEKEAPQLQQEDLTKFAYIVDQDASDISKYNQAYFSNPENRANLRQEILNRAKQDTRLKAISWMGQEIRKRNKLTGNVQEKIEGVLNPEALKSKLAWEMTHERDPNVNKTKKYVMDWIDKHPDQLEKFVYAVTGIRTLSAENVKIQIFDRDKDFVPVAHTCYCALELTSNYENQEMFDQKMELFLSNALAGSGFTLI